MQQGAYILEAKTACFLGGCIPDSLVEDVRPLSTLQTSSTSNSTITRQETVVNQSRHALDEMDMDITPFPPTLPTKPEYRLSYFSTLLNSTSKEGWVRCFAARLHHMSVSEVSRQWEVIVELHDGANSSAMARLHHVLAASKLGNPPFSNNAEITAEIVGVMQRFVGIFLVSVVASSQQAQQEQSKVVFEVQEEAVDITPFLQFFTA